MEEDSARSEKCGAMFHTTCFRTQDVLIDHLVDRIRDQFSASREAPLSARRGRVVFGIECVLALGGLFEPLNGARQAFIEPDGHDVRKELPKPVVGSL